MQLLRPFIVAMLAAPLAVFAQGGFGDGPAVQVELAEVRATELEFSVTAVGTLLAEASATMRPELPGQIEAIHFTEGGRVEKGAKMFSLEATVLEAEANEARANAERSKAAYERAKDLHAKKLLSASEYEAARANYDVDAARLLSSRAKLSKTVVRAPFAGFAGLRRVNVGDYVVTGQELVDLVQLDPMRVGFAVPETLLDKINPGQAVEVTVDAYPGDVFAGRITAVAPQVDANGHSLEIRASLPNGDFRLRPGLFARISVSLGVKPDAIVVPEEAIWPVGRDKTVYLVVDGTARQRVVSLGERRPGVVEIVSGLEVGDVIVTAGQMKLHDGAKVQAAAGAAAVH